MIHNESKRASARETEASASAQEGFEQQSEEVEPEKVQSEDEP